MDLQFRAMAGAEALQQILGLVAQILQQQQGARQMALDLDEELMKQQEMIQCNLIDFWVPKMMLGDGPEAFFREF